MGRTAANTNATQRDLRLDPFSLPVRYSAILSHPNGVAAIVLGRDHVTVKRPLGGIDATLSCPIRAFRGVAVRMTVDAVSDRLRTEIELMHPDSAMSLPLASVEDLGDGEDVAADWQAWGKALGLPLLIIETDGTVREAMPRLGGLDIQAPRARRMVASMKRRRPRFLKRRKIGSKGETARVEVNEIIARD
ncbi:hypothetical protein SAMN02745157_0846 [Kaistia soli DSM 19436]|uniref:Uncharacterized protein n=1 Tax=Kaistia soli DSM 19436 TaxID=1122133 RepID=A0A1M4W122_9HYPH|nr:DUF6101 family protein [Kaistia soli]SHE74845.1 hypothetical protein SAMN02745157_0846 [Kaistia soli DSM 19436]